MASLKSHPNKNVTGVDYVDERSTLYYGKYNYRARLTLEGLNRTYSVKTFPEFKKLIAKQSMYSGNRGKRIKEEIDKIDLPSIERYLVYKQANAKNNVSFRVEDGTAAVFSNDLNLLKELENIAPGIGKVDYTEIDQSIPQGTKYYVKKPPHNYRVYLKSKRIDENTKDGLRRFIDRYKDTGTVVVPSNSFSIWLNPGQKSTWYWNALYMSSHYYIDFDEESTDTLFSIMFGDLIHRRYKLEKRPE
jgi:hypothetical protein